MSAKPNIDSGIERETKKDFEIKIEEASNGVSLNDEQKDWRISSDLVCFFFYCIK